jgi:hypothetical protein
MAGCTLLTTSALQQFKRFLGSCRLTLGARPTLVAMHQPEIRAGDLLAEKKERGELNSGHNKQNLRASHAAAPVLPKLADIGVTKTQCGPNQRTGPVFCAVQPTWNP